LAGPKPKTYFKFYCSDLSSNNLKKFSKEKAVEATEQKEEKRKNPACKPEEEEGRRTASTVVCLVIKTTVLI
jgi:hypothetical protein